MKRRIDQIIGWLGEDFDGLIVFDEAHKMQNATQTRGARGSQKPSQVALAGIALQDRLKNARVLLVSATGATEVRNLAYATRLGLWGEQTQFPDQASFIGSIEAGGLAAMEVVARDLKAQGLYASRSLSYDGVTQEPLENTTHALDGHQRILYDKMGNAWLKIMRGAEKRFIELHWNGMRISNARSQLFSASQRFFSFVLTSMASPKMFREIDKDLAEGNSVVVQLVNTNEAGEGRALARMEEEGTELDDIDTTPRDILINYLTENYPVQLFETYIDDNGAVKTRPVYDSEGNPVNDPEAEADRDSLIEEMMQLPIPANALELLLNKYGGNSVAEVTGRDRRTYVEPKTGRRVDEKRSPSIVKADIRAFLDDRKQILVFSKAGGTGASYHSDITFKNQRKRAHYVAQPGWIAADALQGLGRTHRSNEANQPIYKLMTTDVPAHMRFIATIARRLDQLGALTRGQRQASGQTLFSSEANVESAYGQDAIHRLFESIGHGDEPGITVHDVEDYLDIRIVDKWGNFVRENIPDVKRFLNRLLMVPLDKQALFFDAFYGRFEQVVNTAKANGTYDAGVESIQAEDYNIVDERTVHVHKSGAESKYVELGLTQKQPLFSWNDVLQKMEGVSRNKQSGKLWAYGQSRHITNPHTGRVHEGRTLISTTQGRHIVSINDFEEKYDILDQATAEKAWTDELDAAPKTYTETLHMVSGSLLPIWNLLPHSGGEQVRRIQVIGKPSILGRLIPESDVVTTLGRLGAGQSFGRTIDTSNIIPKIIDNNVMLTLNNDWKIKRSMVSGEYRIELIGPDYFDNSLLNQWNIIKEKIGFNMRYFIPVGEDGQAMIDRILKTFPAMKITSGEGGNIRYSTVEAAPAVHRGRVVKFVENVIKPFRQQFVTPIHVVQSVNDLPLHYAASVRLEMQKGGVIRGFLDPNTDEMWLIADSMAGRQDVIETVLHEVVGHFGLRKVLGPEID
ncbi:MAG: strawberry notch C-terminal domain-containing protein, partial [Lentisphaerota bacterium]